MQQTQALTLVQLNAMVTRAVQTTPGLQSVWVVAETADVRTTGGNCYMDLVQKDPQTGRQLAKIRATIWKSVLPVIAHKFMMETGTPLTSDMNVMVLGSVTYHALYGMSFTIQDINGSFTMGEVMKRRNMILTRLQQENILEMNRTLPWPAVPSRIAVISAQGAAGYGDFINQLYHNPYRLRFSSRLFPAAMQGERTVPSIISALETIIASGEPWDCVVIIRGGGATSDLLCFDDYELAANIAQFPIPVIIGIGHERDITVLDYVANMRVKTPTAAAEFLIQRGADALAYLQAAGAAILQTVTRRMGESHKHLAYISGQLPDAANGAVIRARQRLTNARIALAGIGDRRLRPALSALDSYADRLKQATEFAISRCRHRLDSDAKLIEALSPEATLKRGYSITRIAGRAVTSCRDVRPDEILETRLADGSVLSRIVATDPDNKEQTT